MTPGDLAGLYDAVVLEVEVAFRSRSGSHDWDHTTRVSLLCATIGVVEGADTEVLRLAALLHDIGRAAEDEVKGSLNHAALGARMARAMLNRLGPDSKLVDAICHCISTHRFRGKAKPESLEARVLYDADKLDAIGAIGLARAYVFAGEVGARVHDKHIVVDETSPYTSEDTAYREYLVKLSKIKDHMLTETGRRMALPRHEFMEAFFRRLNAEVDGEA